MFFKVFTSALTKQMNRYTRSIGCNKGTGFTKLFYFFIHLFFNIQTFNKHFNDNYIESDKFPKATFKGHVENNSEINYGTDGNYTARVKGQLSIHGVTKDIETSGTISIKDGKPVLNSIFSVLIADYNITVQRIHRDNISRTIKITVEAALTPL